jgi:hypothetical protein
MTKVIKSLLTFVIAASVIFQGTALAVMVGCHTGDVEQSASEFSPSPSILDHCAEHTSAGNGLHPASADHESQERPCCSCDAIYKAKLDLPVVEVGLIESKRLFSVSFSSILPSADLALPYRPPILA